MPKKGNITLIKGIEMKDKKRLLLIAKIAKIAAIIMIVLSAVVYLLVIIYEMRNYCKIYDSTLAFSQTLTGLVAILVASETAKGVFVEPQFVFEVFDQHDSPFEYTDNKYLPIAIDSDAHIGYLPYSPTDWEIDVVNVGKTSAQNIKVEISIDGVSFEDKSNLYDVRDFIYGCGVFDKIVFDTGEGLKPNERLRLPKIPFQYAECECLENDKGKMHISIYNDEIEVTCFLLDICFVKEDMKLFYGLDEIIYDDILEKEIGLFAIEQNEECSVDTYHTIPPYCCAIKSEKRDIYGKIYKMYSDLNFFEYSRNPLTRKIVRKKMGSALKQKMLFWGRIYYRSCGLSVSEIEAILINDILE